MQPEQVHVVCPDCLAINRVPVARTTEDPVCGRCAGALLPGAPVILTDANFERFTARSDLPVLVDFWAPWCGPCVAMSPHFEQAARQLKGQALLVKVDSDANPATAARFGIRSIPTLVRLVAGRETGRQTGGVQAAQIVAMLR